jgi:tripartite-type tricarboxylate transporter receptor subunit TctC
LALSYSLSHLLKLSFDPIKDLTPIGLVVTVPNVLVVGSNVPANNVKELIALMKAKPDDFKYASSGVGSTQHIAGEGFDIAAGVKSIHVPYKGSAPALVDLLGGQLAFTFDTVLTASPLIQEKRLKAFAVSGPTRARSLPNIPTMQEAGFKDFDITHFLWCQSR